MKMKISTLNTYVAKGKLVPLRHAKGYYSLAIKNELSKGEVAFGMTQKRAVLLAHWAEHGPKLERALKAVLRNPYNPRARNQAEKAILACGTAEVDE